MRVLHLITKLGIGGAERMAETLAVASAADGLEVSVLAVARSDENDDVGEAMRGRLRAAGVRVVDASTATSKKAAVILAVPAIAREVSEWIPDIVHVHTEVPQLALALARILWPPVRRPSTVLTVHSTVNWPSWGLLGRLSQWVLRDAYPVAVSECARYSYARASDSDCGVVLNGVSVAELGCHLETLRQPPRYLFAARLEPEKGIDVLMEALARLEGSRARFELDILGAGSLAPEVGKFVVSLSRRVRFGSPSATLRSDLCDYDALVMPSRHEGLSLLAIEALCVGLPILATSAQGLVDTLPPGYPGCVPPNDPGALAKLLEAFECDPQAWLDRMAPDRDWARSRYHSRAMVEGYARVYEAAVAGSRSVVAATRS